MLRRMLPASLQAVPGGAGPVVHDPRRPKEPWCFRVVTRTTEGIVVEFRRFRDREAAEAARADRVIAARLPTGGGQRDGLIPRTARKEWRCSGDGTASHRHT